MQQATTAMKPGDSGTGGNSTPPQLIRNQFVINLCASTTPVALTPPDHAGLKRFTFFVSRRREEGRERFRLHMGYFRSQEEAEQLLDIVREIYPGAWAGLAPGQRLRAQAQAAAEEAASAAQAAAASQPAAGTSDAARAAPAPDATAIQRPPAELATAMAAAAAAQIPTPVVEATPSAIALATTIAAPAAAAAPAATLDELSLVPDQGRRVSEADVARENEAATRALSNVRAAIASLDDSTTATPVLAPLPELKPAPRARDLSDAAALKVLESAAVDTTSESTINQPRPPISHSKAPVVPATATTAASASAAPGPSSGAVAAGSAAATAPKINGSGAVRDDKTTYAVQLLWSVKPIDIAQIPQLAIFSAYTLYGAEGNRDGRRWYGVRLGFFTDAVSAKQVAHYVRSDFSTVSVVPVTSRERERAKIAASPAEAAPAAAAANATSAAARTAPAATSAESKLAAPAFQFIEDSQKAAPVPGAALTASGTAIAAAGHAAGAGAAAGARVSSGTSPARAMSGRSAPGKRAKLRNGRPVNGRAKSRPMTLEETLEILGAGQLQIDDGRRPLINVDAPRATVEPTKGKPSRFGRLLERLSERLGS
jgi:hypothetical protein